MNPDTFSYREKVFSYVRKKYKSKIEYLWKRYPGYAVFRHEENKKWYGLVMDVPRNRLGLPGDEIVDILNVKLDDWMLRDMLIRKEGYYPGYHISRGNWISILLDGTVPEKEIFEMIDTGWAVTAPAEKKQKYRPPKEWLVPANPKYFDIVHAFDNTDTIRWKQGAGIRPGDTVYMYVAAPVSSVLYRCGVTECGIPYKGNRTEIRIRNLMMIRLERRYPPEQFTFEKLKDEYGIYAVRGPRGIPNSLSEDFRR